MICDRWLLSCLKERFKNGAHRNFDMHMIFGVREGSKITSTKRFGNIFGSRVLQSFYVQILTRAYDKCAPKPEMPFPILWLLNDFVKIVFCVKSTVDQHDHVRQPLVNVCAKPEHLCGP